MKQHENTFILGINETTWEYFYIRYKWNNMRIYIRYKLRYNETTWGINETTWEYFYIRYKWNNMRILLY